MRLAVVGLGTAVPPTRVAQTDALAINRRLCGPAADRTSWLPKVYQHTGIQTRHTVLGDAVVADLLHQGHSSNSPFVPTEEGSAGPGTGERMRHYGRLAPPLAIEAATTALANSGRPANAITHLITVSCTGFSAPGVDVSLIRALGLAPSVQRTHVGYMGCHGAINGLRVAKAFAGSHPSACVLLCAVELCTLHLHYGTDTEQMIANALFADGAAAIVGVPEEIDSTQKWGVSASGSFLLPDSTDAMTWTISDHGFVMSLSRAVPRLIATHVRPWIESWLAQNDLTLDQVGSWAVHPGGPRILSAVEEGLALTPVDLAPSRSIFAGYGNMSSPTVLFILERLRAQQAALPCVMLGFGPGLMVEALLLR